MLHLHQRAHEFLLVGLYVDAVHPGMGLSGGEQDGLVLPGAEVGVVGREGLRRDEVVDEPLRLRLGELLEIAEQLDGGVRNHLFQNGAEPRAYEDVGGQDGYGGALLHYSW